MAMTTTSASDEATPLLSKDADADADAGADTSPGGAPVAQQPAAEWTFRQSVFAFTEGKSLIGERYERFTAFLIVVNVVAFVLATLFVEKYNSDAPWAARGVVCGNVCDALWFGNFKDNGLESLGFGTTSILEIFTVLIFSLDYVCRLWTADLEHAKFRGFWGRLRYLPTFYSIVDLASTVPFYVDAFILTKTDLVASQFLRMFRLFRMMRVEGRYDTALTMFDDVFYEQRGILGTALFVGVTTWMTVSSLYYICERRSLDMIYCGTAPDYCGDADEIDVSLCVIDYWGVTDCSAAGCPSTDEYPEPCYNLYKSIPMASYYSLLNLFGEFPLIDQHNVAGKIVASIVAIVAVAVFALPAGIIGNGFEDLIERRRIEQGIVTDRGPIEEEGGLTRGFVADNLSNKGWWYNFLHAHTTNGARLFDDFVNFLILGTSLTFMIGTLAAVKDPGINIAMDIFELASVIIFTGEYALRVYSASQDPKYSGPGGTIKYMCTFLAMVDLLTVAPYWTYAGFTREFVAPVTDADSTWSNVVKCLRLLRLLRFEKYTHAFTSFDDVVSQNMDVLAVTGYTALLVWVFLATILYFTERDSRDSEMASNYKTVPDAMWMTLLNLSGESPLAQYSVYGKFITGILGLFATGLFGIPIGILGAGFERVVGAENRDTPDEKVEEGTRAVIGMGSSFEIWCFDFVNGVGSRIAKYFETGIYFLIFLTVGVGIWQTVDGHDKDFFQVEWLAVIIFTIEYLIRLVGVGADPEFATGRNWFTSRIAFIFSFYSTIDLLAILPFYIAAAAPSSWVNDYDEMFRMFRLLRLLKLDKYVPSITLIDDVFRLKKQSLVVAGYAAGMLWIVFSAMLFVVEHNDFADNIDNVPAYGCFGNCTMSDRFQNYFDSMVYTGVHLTGDYPITTYDWPGRFINFFMVIAAVGVVAIPSGLIANGFVTLVQSKAKRKAGDNIEGDIGDDWYERRLREIRTEEMPLSRWGPTVDKWQIAVNEYLNGRTDGSRSGFSRASRVFIFTVIILNVIAVLAESVPEIDRYVTNEPGNFFDLFEKFSVFCFAMEYTLRLFCAPKNYDALCSSWVYATTFFGIVDFLSTAPWFIEKALIHFDVISNDSDAAMMFRIFRIFRMLQLEDFIIAFSKLDNVFRASMDVLRATGLMALIVWVGCGALFFIFEVNNPNWRSCDSSIPSHSTNPKIPGCYDFPSTSACNEFYPGLCQQAAFTNVPNSLYYTAIFLGGEWGVIDFTWPGRVVCLFLCVVGIALYAIPIGTLFDSFGSVLGIGGDDEEEDGEGGDDDK